MYDRRPKRQALVDADVLDPERAGLLDHAQAGILVMQEEATPIGAPLGIALPGGHAPFLGEPVHPLKITVLVWVYAAMDQEAMRCPPSHR